jgi:hypothetical protein
VKGVSAQWQTEQQGLSTFLRLGETARLWRVPVIQTSFGGYDKPKLMEKIRKWFVGRAGEGGEACTDASHMVIIVDDFDGVLPQFVRSGEDVRACIAEVGRSRVEKVMEVYDLSLDLEKQLAEPRAFHL